MMQPMIRHDAIVVITLVGLVTGCTAGVSPQVQQVVNEARAHFQVVESLEADESFPDDYREARQKLSEAEGYLHSEFSKDKALTPAKQSLSASQRILQNFYRNTITPLARKAKTEIEKITEADPDNPLQDFLPKINDLLDYSEAIEDGTEILALNRVIRDLEDVINIKHNADTNVNATLASDVSFDTGKYALSARGKQLLRDFFSGIIAQQRDYLDHYADQTITMRIKVVGYTDQQGFRKGTALWQALLEGVEEQFPTEPIQQRRFLNQRLSHFRANTISGYIRNLIEAQETDVFIEQNIIGRGEDVPPGITVSYPPEDSVADGTRRICKIYSYVLVH
jgi:outer membrane protein OmpA-like peptidoglycan-associated protein